MYLKINGIRYTEKDSEINFTKLTKLNNNLYCYINNELYCTFNNILDWSKFSIENGKFTEEITKEEKLLLVNQQLSKQINDLLIENKKNKEINKILAQQINNINIKLNSRGDK